MYLIQPWRHPELVVPDLLCVLVCGVAAILDLRSRRIPNWLTFPAILVGLAVNTLLPALLHGAAVGLRVGLLSAVAGALLLLLVFGLLGAIRFVGMGDVKLMAAVGALLRWPTALWALAYVSLCGGIVAVLYALFTGRMRAVMGNLLSLGRRVVRPRRPPEQGAVRLHRIPYATAIFLGASWAAAVKYFPWLALGAG